MSENIFQVIYNGKVEKDTAIPMQDIDREIKDQNKGTNIVRVNEEGTALMQIKHGFVNVGESIAQIKCSTSAQVTEYGTVKVVQFKQEISSRGEDVFYFSNDTATFEGTLADAKEAFPDVEFDDLNLPPLKYEDHPELGRIPFLPNTVHDIQWTHHNHYDSEENGGKPTNWNKWADATQTALDAVGLIPGIGEFADLANGVISLARGNYADAALSFAAMIPFFGTAATVTKQARKIRKVIKSSDEATEGVYDLIIKKNDDITGYVGQSKDVFKRIEQHFNPKRGKLAHTVLEEGSTVHKMVGSTKPEREIYEQLIILEKYAGQINPQKNLLAKLLNKVNPVGGRYKIINGKASKEFYEKAYEIADKYGLPKTFK